MKFKYLNIFDDLNNLIINLMLLADDDILDILLINTCSSKYLYFNIIEKDSISDFLVNISDKSSIFIMLIF